MLINKDLVAKKLDFLVVHGYNDFDFKLLFKDYKQDLKDLRQFGAEILKYLESFQ